VAARAVSPDVLDACVAQTWSIAHAAGLDDGTAREICALMGVRLGELASRRPVPAGHAVLAWAAEVAHKEVHHALLLAQWRAAAAGGRRG
jgi:hypothetical protein